MNASEDGISIIKQFEGFRPEAYLPTSDDVPTVGFGTTRIDGKPVPLGLKVTEEEAEELLKKDIRIAEETVSRLVDVDISQAQRDALISFVYNIGSGNFASSTLLKKLNEGDFEGAQKEFGRWNKQNKKELPGLTERRRAEAELFAKGTQELIEEDKQGRIAALTTAMNKT